MVTYTIRKTVSWIFVFLLILRLFFQALLPPPGKEKDDNFEIHHTQENPKIAQAGSVAIIADNRNSDAYRRYLKK